jgi:hypothetical protein
MTAVAPAKFFPSLARWPASPAACAAANGGAFPLSSMTGASTWKGKNSGSPWWPRAEVQALVKRHGASLPAGRRRRRGAEEIEEGGAWRRSGPAPPPRTAPAWRRTARSHGRTPRLLPPPLTLLLDVTGGGLGRRIPNWLGFEPRAAAVFL